MGSYKVARADRGRWTVVQERLHGMSSLTAGDRYVLGCPFDEYK